MSAARPGTAIIGAITATVLALWLSYAVAAALMQSGHPASGAASPAEAAPVGIVLTPVPELRLRAELRRHAAETRVIEQPGPPVSAPTPPAHRAPAPRAMSAPPTPVTTTPAPTPPAQAPTPKPTVTSTPTPTPTPKPATKPRPTPTAQPTKPARPDFDDSSPSGFDTSG